MTTERLDTRVSRSASSSVSGMMLFVASEAVFFAAFFGIYASSYTAAKVWPPPGLKPPHLAVPSASVVVVLASGLCMLMCMRRLRRSGSPERALPWLAATLIGALAFGVLVAVGLTDVGFGIGDGIYQSLFYVVVGLELAHVAGGLILLLLVLLRSGEGELALRTDPVECAAIYWYFVVALAVVIYVVLYLGVR
jgi:cytochrome c oxidase subunit 3